MTKFLKQPTKLKFLLRQLKYLFYKYFKGLLKWKKINGIYLDITHSSISDKELYYLTRNLYENSEYKLIVPEIVAEDRIVEFGSGMGYMASALSNLTKNQIVTFEANPNTISLIKKVLKKNNSNAQVIHAAIVPNDYKLDIVDFFLSEHLIASTLMSSKNGHKVKVPAKKVEDVLLEYEPNTLVIDIEGAENDVLISVDWTKYANVKKIFVETHLRFTGEEPLNAMISYMNKTGFVIAKQMNNQLYFKK